MTWRNGDGPGWGFLDGNIEPENRPDWLGKAGERVIPRDPHPVKRAQEYGDDKLPETKDGWLVRFIRSLWS